MQSACASLRQKRGVLERENTTVMQSAYASLRLKRGVLERENTTVMQSAYASLHQGAACSTETELRDDA
jgi:hypothetical protein